MYSHLGQGQLSLAAVRGLSNLTNAERYKLIQVAEVVGADPDILAAVISLETAGTFDPAIVNQACARQGGDINRCATGLIQFIPSTARSLGTTTAALRTMSVCQQLDVVQAYYQKFGRRISIPGDEYVAVFAPNFIGAADAAVVYRQGDPGYDLNRGLDMNGNGAITVRELRQNVLNRVAGARSRPAIAVTPESCGASGRGGRGGLLAPVAIIGAAAALFWGTLRGTS